MLYSMIATSVVKGENKQVNHKLQPLKEFKIGGGWGWGDLNVHLAHGHKR